MNQPALKSRAARIKCLFRCIEDEVRLGRSRRCPTDDVVGEGADYRAIEGAIGLSPIARGPIASGDVNNALPG